MSRNITELDNANDTEQDVFLDREKMFKLKQNERLDKFLKNGV